VNGKATNNKTICMIVLIHERLTNYHIRGLLRHRRCYKGSEKT